MLVTVIDSPSTTFTLYHIPKKKPIKKSHEINLFFVSFQFWSYSEDTQLIRHGSSDKCLAINEKRDKIVMEECNPTHKRQMWKLENYDPTKM